MGKWWNSYTRLCQTSLSRAPPMMSTKPDYLLHHLMHPPSLHQSSLGGVALIVWLSHYPLQCPYMPYPPPWFLSIHFLFTFLPQLPIPGGVVPFCNLLIFAIFLRSYTGDILYYLCATVTYRNFTGSVWFPVWPLCKGIILYPCIIFTRSTQKIGSKTWMCYQIYNF